MTSLAFAWVTDAQPGAIGWTLHLHKWHCKAPEGLADCVKYS